MLAQGCRSRSLAVTAFLSTWLPAEEALAGSCSFSPSFAVSCHASTEQFFLFDSFLFLYVLLGFWLFCVSASP